MEKSGSIEINFSYLDVGSTYSVLSTVFHLVVLLLLLLFGEQLTDLIYTQNLSRTIEFTSFSSL